MGNPRATTMRMTCVCPRRAASEKTSWETRTPARWSARTAPASPWVAKAALTHGWHGSPKRTAARTTGRLRAIAAVLHTSMGMRGL